jgi:hypothetical protein
VSLLEEADDDALRDTRETSRSVAKVLEKADRHVGHLMEL